MRKFIVITIITITTFKLYGQVIEFERIGLQDGLSQVSVMAISQDKFGTIWIGTRNGLNRYDGKRMTTFRTKRSGASILENQIQAIASTDSLIWIQSPNSISTFNLQTEEFSNYQLSSISSLMVRKDEIWAATRFGLFKMDYESKNFDKAEFKLRENELISCLASNGKGLLIGTNLGVWELSETNQILITKNRVEVKALFIDRKSNVWVGTNRKGLLKVKGHKIVEHYRGGSDLSNDFVRCIEEDDDGKIWVGTFTGLDVISANGTVTHYKNDKSLNSSLSHNSIWSLYKDRDGAMWVGTYFGGVNIFHPTRKLFNYYPENGVENKSINFRVVGQVVEDNQKNLWICTDGGGLNFLDRKTGDFRYYEPHPTKNSISHKNVKSLCWQGDSVLWIGTHRAGLNRFYPKTGEFQSYISNTTERDYLVASEIASIVNFEDYLLLGAGSELLQFDLETYKFSNFLPVEYQTEISSSILSILRVQENEIWIGTERSGLFIYDIKNNEFKNHRSEQINRESLPSSCIYSIFKDRIGHMWVGTSDGLSRYISERKSFINYTTDDGLPGNIVFGIVESRFSGLVIETDKGISFFEPEKNVFRNITFNNGLPLRELSHKGILNTSDGYLFISGNEGLVSLFENHFLNRKPTTQPLVSQLAINNQFISPHRSPSIIKQTILESPEVNLKWEHSSITFSITDMAYTRASRQELEYKLEGFDEMWVNAGDRSSITYTNLDDGEYTFQLRGKSNPDAITKVLVKVTPPFYFSSWAIMLYILFGIGIIVLINYQYITQSKLNYSLVAEKESHAKDKELNRQKIRFFTNISHEFRTPLTLITGQVELLLENSVLAPSTYKKIVNIQKNTSRLKSLISELLDFRKLEQGHLKIRVMPHDFIKFMQEIFVNFAELAKHGHVDYSMKNDFSHFELWFDKTQLEKVFYNLLANAFKFTPEQGHVAVNVFEVGDHLYTEVVNTGSYIPKRKVEKVFDRFYQLDNLGESEEEGTGVGLSLTKGIIEAHHGEITVISSFSENTTSFKVKLKKGKNHFLDKELEKNAKRVEFITNVENALKVSTEFPKSLETILIVEDNKEVMDFLVELLNPLFKIKKAANGLDALEVIKKTPPDLILSDVLMPKMSGTELCAALKSDILTSHIPIILLTAKGSDEHRIEGLETGADDYLTKPFSTKILIVRINNILNTRKYLQSKYSENPIHFARKVAKKRIDRDFMEKAQGIVLENINNSSYSVDLFSKDMGLGRTNLFLKIKGIIGQTPNEFITGIRLGKAAQMIIHHPEISVSDIAYSCGFSNPNYFSRSFKKKYNVSPSGYRGKIEADA